MRAVIQRVTYASVTVEEEMISEISEGLLVFLGIEDADTHKDIQWLVQKIYKLRIFNDPKGLMNCSLQDTGGEILIISQFTLFAATKKGNRPSYIRAAKPDYAVPIYNDFLMQMEHAMGRKVKAGVFGADMKVQLLNDGPVTIIIDTKSKE